MTDRFPDPLGEVAKIAKIAWGPAAALSDPFAMNNPRWEAYRDAVDVALHEAGWEWPAVWQPAPSSAVTDPAAPAVRRFPFPFGGPLDGGRRDEWRVAAERAMRLADQGGWGFTSAGPDGGRWVEPQQEGSDG